MLKLMTNFLKQYRIISTDIQNIPINLFFSLWQISTSILITRTILTIRTVAVTNMFGFFQDLLSIIFMASLNYSVLSVARASERSVEIGIRKVNGQAGWAFFRQFLTESVFQTFSATSVGLLVVLLVLPWFNKFLGWNFYSIFPRINYYSFLLTFIVGIIVGIYPSF